MHVRRWSLLGRVHFVANGIFYYFTLNALPPLQLIGLLDVFSSAKEYEEFKDVYVCATVCTGVYWWIGGSVCVSVFVRMCERVHVCLCR